VHRLKNQRGQALVEFALILPILLTLVLGIFDFGTAYNYQNDMSQLANEAARYASVGSCGKDSTGTALCSHTNQIPAVVKADADTGALRDPSTGATITIGFPSGSNGCKGDPVKATVTQHYTWIPYLHLASTTITASATMRLETAYDALTSPYTPNPGPVGTCS
jgi:Flp pilus assembly protein TadG